MYEPGFCDVAMHAYILVVNVHSAFVHANVGWRLDWLGRFLVTPRFHHWHHGVEREAIDVNFAIHFPLLDRLFGTHHLPERRWPGGYGIEGRPVPRSYWAHCGTRSAGSAGRAQVAGRFHVADGCWSRQAPRG